MICDRPDRGPKGYYCLRAPECVETPLSLPTDLLEHSSDATGATEVVAGVSSIPALLQLVNV